MKPAVFEYHKPDGLVAALKLLDELAGEDCKVLAGGQSLMPLMNIRLVQPSHVVDINGLAELAYVHGQDRVVAVGSLTRHRQLEQSPEIARGLKLLAQCAPLIGDRQIRSRGTLGGSLAHADPAAELPLAAVALDAEVVLASSSGRRSMPARDFFLGSLTTSLEANELLVEVRFPELPPHAGCAFLELARQHGAFAIVAAAAVVLLDGDRVAEARVCLGGVGPTPIRATEAEQRLRGETLSASLLADAARLAAAVTDPGSDVHGSEEYRRAMSAVFARRALEAAILDARGAATDRTGGH